jgi:hypothetical protein
MLTRRRPLRRGFGRPLLRRKRKIIWEAASGRVATIGSTSQIVFGIAPFLLGGFEDSVKENATIVRNFGSAAAFLQLGAAGRGAASPAICVALVDDEAIAAGGAAIWNPWISTNGGERPDIMYRAAKYLSYDANTEAGQTWHFTTFEWDIRVKRKLVERKSLFLFVNNGNGQTPDFFAPPAPILIAAFDFWFQCRTALMLP